MATLKTQIEKKRQNYTSLRSAFHNESGAIDLASIMVGIIVIGLIGGVIAATVFVVIPWTQDNAAKQQLESIHTAENASYGLSADPTVVPDETKRNKFTNSAGLQTASLLTTNPNYCAIPTADGQNYNAYAKSASGKVWTATNGKKTPTVLTTGVTCLGTVTGGVLDPTTPTTPITVGPGDGTGTTTPVTPPAPVYTPVFTTEADTLTGFTGVNTFEFKIYAASGASKKDRNGGTGNILVAQSNGSVGAGVLFTNNTYVVGDKYRVTAWVSSNIPNGSVTTSKDGINGTTVVVGNSTAGDWKPVSVEFTATDTSQQVKYFFTSGGNGSIHIDAVTIDKIS